MDPIQLQQLYSLLKTACESSDTNSQQKVYNSLNSLERHVQFYIGLANISARSQIELKCRQMALLTLKSALERNSLQIQFTDDQLTYIRTCILSIKQSNNELLSNAQKSLIALLSFWNKQINYEILSYLLQSIKSQIIINKLWALDILYNIFEDFKFQRENLNYFHNPQFYSFLSSYSNIFMVNINNNNHKLWEKSLLCMNLLLKYMNNVDNNSQTIQNYLKNYLIPILISENCNDKIFEITLDGIIQIAQINSMIIFKNKAALQSIANFNNEKKEVMRNWLSLVLDLFETDGKQQKMKNHLLQIIPKIIKNLVFTKEDQFNVKMEMQQESNPYEYQQIQNGIEENDQRTKDYGYTNRKLSVLLLQRLIVQYIDELWSICQPTIRQLLSSQNLLQKQYGILMIGLIFEKKQSNLQFLQMSIPIIMSQINNTTLPDVLRCTCLWVIGKIYYLIIRQETLNQEIQANLIQCLQNSTNQVRDTVYSTLDQMMCCIEQPPYYLSQIANCIEKGIKNCNGKPLYIILKTCSTLYQKHANKIPEQITKAFIIQLCLKWSINIKTQSIMSPILQCLVTISSANTNVFKQFAFDIFKESCKILQNTHQKTMVIRAIDLISSIISINDSQVTQTITNDENLHNIFHNLITSQEKQIKNFSYGLLGDICKVTSIPKFAEWYIQTIGNSFNGNNLTSCSNALTCLTDLIVSHPSLAQKYSGTVIALAIEKLKTKNIQPVYSFNFARIYGRLGYVNPTNGSLYLKQNLSLVCSGLRAREQHKLTDQAYRGIFMMIIEAPQSVMNCFEFLVQSFVCYPCGDREVSQMFISILKQFRKSLKPNQWNRFLSKRIFLQAVANKIQVISS